MRLIVVWLYLAPAAESLRPTAIAVQVAHLLEHGNAVSVDAKQLADIPEAALFKNPVNIHNRSNWLVVVANRLPIDYTTSSR